ncbi:cation transporter HKT4 [Selaginella moellendorffii]|uniref:cation transporter HKT4 n=1 Tax=Selaginella moellendorffii TaxID=88036 RepID=UPI000D1CA433|nr:cation transporter HKT4 [Selaginella moellendorffii]|eukprot:XP_024541100.1 cation transporter HKT4 [Selaginella moellendorffii]
MLMMILGGQVVTSVVPLFVKKRRYCDVARQVLEQDDRKRPSSSSNPDSDRDLVPNPNAQAPQNREDDATPTSATTPSSSQGPPGSLKRTQSGAVRLLRRLSGSMKLRSKEDVWMREMASKKHAQHLREIFQEHSATVSLTWIVVWYYILVHLIGFFITWGCILGDASAKSSLESKNINIGFFALFLTVSSFANAGFVLVDENMTLFSSSTVLLLALAAIILLGNTMFAPSLRGIIWLLHRVDATRREDYEFLLEHPRKCYTHLFPRTTTLWLVLAVTGFNGFECLMFYILDWKSKALEGFGTGDKVVNGIFQSVNTRSAGMNSMNLADLSPSMLFLYCGMMYIAAYPVFLSRQYSRHYEAKEQRASVIVGLDRDVLDTTITTQSKRLLAQDWAYLFLATFFICVSDNKQLKSDPRNFTIFSVIFEVIRYENSSSCKTKSLKLRNSYKLSSKLQNHHLSSDQAHEFLI